MYNWHNELSKTNEINSDRLRHPDEKTYLTLQSLGLISGVVKNSGQLFFNFSNALYQSYGSQNGKPMEEKTFFIDVIRFYEVIAPSSLSINWFNSRSLSSRAKKTLQNRSKMIGRIGRMSTTQSLFVQSTLLIEVLLFEKYIRSKSKEMLNYLVEEKAKMFANCAMVISAAAQANDTVDKEERDFFHAFIKKSKLRKHDKKILLDTIDKPIFIEEIKLSEYSSWVYRKFLMEIAWFTVWMDRKLEPKETAFMEKLGQHLSVSVEDSAISALVVESQLALQGEFKEAKAKLIERIKTAITSNQQSILNRIRANDNLIKLLKKGNTRELSTTDRNEVRDSLFSEVQSMALFRYITFPSSLLSYKEVTGLLSSEMMKDLVN